MTAVLVTTERNQLYRGEEEHQEQQGAAKTEEEAPESAVMAPARRCRAQRWQVRATLALHCFQMAIQYPDSAESVAHIGRRHC